VVTALILDNKREIHGLLYKLRSNELDAALKLLMIDAGIYLLATVSGTADVHAVALSLSRMATHSIALSTAVVGIVLAASVNNLFKVVLTLSTGTGYLTRCIIGPMLASALAGLAAAWLL
jgi:uncharacterized membrane protein (DUF4010 family)